MGGTCQEMSFLRELTDIKPTLHEKVKDDGNLMLSLPIKEVDSSSVGVNINKDGVLSLIFKTKDKNVLEAHPGSREDTSFVWHYEINEKVKENCTFTVSPSALCILLERLEPQCKNSGVASNHLPSLNPRPKFTDGLIAQRDKKPTCLVNPMTSFPSSNLENLQLQGYTGLENLGNTCYMNSVVQSLVNTREFRDYFLESRFDSDLNKDNPLGTGGELAVTFSNVCKKLWNAKFKSVDATFLKDVISKRSNQFYGFAQHDAQELMAFLVDGLHEDLNRVRSAPRMEVESKDENEVVADASWSSYKMRNDSMIVDLFQGQYKSKLVCPVCNKISITFDPFLYLSVPMPKKIRLIPVVYFSLDYNRKPVKYYARLSQDAKAEDLKELIANQFNISFAKVSIFEVYRNKIHRFIGKGHTIESVEPNDTIFAFETCLEPQVGEPIVELTVVQRLLMPSPPKRCSFCNRERPLSGIKLKRCTKCYRACYCDESCQKNHWPVHRANCKMNPELVGCPFLITLPQSQCTYSKLYQIMEGYSRYSVDIFKPPLDVSSSSSDQITLLPNKGEVSPLASDDANDPVVSSEITAGSKSEQQLPLFYITPVNQSGITLPAPKGKRLDDKKEVLDLSATPHLAMDWRNNERMKNYVLVETKSLEADCFQSESERRDALNNTSLDQCLNLFCAPETLSPEEAWFCSKCQRNRQATKQMSIRRAPHTLIIQLKRFLFKNSIWREKIDKMVKYPIRGLDLSPYCCAPIPGEKPEPPPIYDLYAVIRHAGSIVSGHYTTTARLLEKDSNDTEIGWRLFDDSRVSHVSESDIVSRFAYVLFYRRRNFAVNFLKTPSSTASAVLRSARNAQMVAADKKEDSHSDVEGELNDQLSINV